MKKAAKANEWIAFFLMLAGLAAAAGLKSFLFLPVVYSQPQCLVSGAEDRFSKAAGEKNMFFEPESFPADCSLVRLSLEDVTNLALQNSLDIQIARLDAYIGKVSLKKAVSIFDAFLTAETSYSRDKMMYSSASLGTETAKYKYSLGVEKKLPSGTTISIDAAGMKNRSDSSLSSLNPYHEALGEVSLIQELGRNFFGIADRSKIKITKIDIENSDFTALDDIEQALCDAQKSYWNYVLQGEILLIMRDMLKESEKLFEAYKDRYSLGLVEESELLAVEALVYEGTNEVVIAVLNKETAKNDLLFLINRGDFRQEIAPKDSLSGSENTVNLYDALRKAIQHRRDYKRVKNELQKNKIDIVVKKNALWPQIDLEASFIRNNIDTGSASAWEGLAKKSNDEVFVKISFKMPFKNQEAKAELEKIKLEEERYLLRLKRIERLILQELNDKANKVNTVYNQIKLSNLTITIHEKKLKEEMKRLNSGRSSADLIIRYEKDLLKARLFLVSCLFKYKAGLIELELSQNTLLDKYWEEPL